MVGLHIFLWPFICHVSAFATVETGSFCLAGLITALLGLWDLVYVLFLAGDFSLPVFLYIDVIEGLRLVFSFFGI